MAQYKKSEIKQQIDDAALSVFAEKGYENTKVSDIAKKANVSVGNIYRYYNSKDELFYSIIPQEFIDSIEKLLFCKLTIGKEGGLESYRNSAGYMLISEQFIRYLIQNRQRFIILAQSGKNTRYENFRNQLVKFLIDTVMENLVDSEKIKTQYGESILSGLNIIFNNLVNMILDVLKQENSDTGAENTLKLINKYHVSGIIEILK